MGEYAREARELGLCGEYNVGSRELVSLYNNDLWSDVSKKVRLISEMDSLHLCFVINYLLASNKDILKNQLKNMCYVLQGRSYLERDFQRDLTNFLIGSYSMYPEEDGVVENYYKKLLTQYPEYDWSYLKQIMYWC